MSTPTMKQLLDAANKSWDKYMHSQPGQHVRTMLGEYFNAVRAVQKKAEAFDDLLTACERAEEMLRAVSEYLTGANPFLGQPDASKHETMRIQGDTAAARRVAELIAPTAAAIEKARGK